MAAELQTIKTFFAGSNILLCGEWLQSCVEWIKEENTGSNLSPQELRSQVYEQWLLVDLTDLQVPVLPPNITTHVKLTLTKSMCLQVVSVVDISKPKLQQIMHMRKTATQDHKNEDNQNGKRVLQLRLTDGVQEVLATEYRPIPCLCINLTPGAKVCLNAPLVVRRGQIMLEAKNIKVLGGEVESLLVSNAAENVLAKVLKLPINPNPTNVEASFDDADKEVLTMGESEIKPAAIKREISSTPRPSAHTNHQAWQPSTSVKDENDSILKEFQDPALFEDTDFDEEIVKPKSQKKNLSFEDIFDQDEFDELMNVDVPEPAPSPMAKPMTIEKLCSMAGKVNRGIFRIHAQFKSIAEKMMMKENEYSMKVCLEDDTGDAVFALHSDVISDLFGYTPDAMDALKKRAADEDPVVMVELHMALEKFKENLVNLDSHMMVLVQASHDFPVVTKLVG